MIRKPVIIPGEQEGAPRNNLEVMVNLGKTVGGAEGEVQRKKAEKEGKVETPQVIK